MREFPISCGNTRREVVLVAVGALHSRCQVGGLAVAGRILLRSVHFEVEGLYDALFSMDESISAALAREFRLVDELVAPGGGAGKPKGAGGCFLIPE